MKKNNGGLQMTRIKFNVLIILIILFGMIFTSCSSDSDSDGNNTFDSATEIALDGNNESGFILESIDSSSDVDYFKFNWPDSRRILIGAASEEKSIGTCNTNPTDTKIIIYDADRNELANDCNGDDDTGVCPWGCYNPETGVGAGVYYAKVEGKNGSIGDYYFYIMLD